MKRKLTPKELIEVKNNLFNPTLFHITPKAWLLSPTDTAFSLFLEKNDLGMVDTILLSFCLEEKFNLLTFDKNLKKSISKI